MGGDGLVYSSKLWQGTSEAQKPAWRGCAGSLVADMKHNDVWAAKRSSNTGYSQRRHLPVPKATIRTFHITVNY